MQETYRTVYRGGTGEIVEKKSRFIADIRLVESEEEALAFIEGKRKQYWDARHHCFAYIIGDMEQTVRASDDGEPSGTAGKPILNVLQGEGLRNIVAVVTRYFGGTLLGTGGLVRAYSQATQEGLKESILIDKKLGAVLRIETDYVGLGKIQYIMGQRGIPLLGSEYTESVALEAMVPVSEEKAFTAELIDATNGGVRIEKTDTCYYGEVNGEVLTGAALNGEDS
ncbi:MAG: YigZ family protein [Lachnospiraceae bacterium]|nr:YigZ family protein [Lachnospiraceae bacterium]